MSKRNAKFMVTYTRLGKILFFPIFAPFLFLGPYFILTGEEIYGVLFTLAGLIFVVLYFHEMAAYIEVHNGNITVCKGKFSKKICFDARDIKYVRKPKIGMFEIMLLDGRLIKFPIMKALKELMKYLEKQPRVMVFIE